ncbi:hypothetical protein H6G80_07500 [Nostoc sp. FACHB-87]|uniref:Tse2 family ADP-ribosyltransferase toxin n=1 Tax=Nostocales TaxID=1161 RepID=UPI0016883EB0|nr:MULTISPECIES: hypothetical protein [Nostocales]MBD2303422.1 hypothetical protein [Nostoc sp. FACHB-190]MBD2453922.1 hypothetical protein [Nostoc sp. FACHB-87]MBD2476047.1 hypothetical protein [Anabaena sp. FACHB-83]MBD2489715.1 hypothetical protein [Aulosira sp. FACHB-615]
MRKTPVDLYRMGNATSSRMDNIRSQDIETYEEDGDILVVAGSGGISTFAVQGIGKNWWKLEKGNDIPNELRLVNDYGNHWLWEPSYTMRMEDYKTALRLVGEAFYKVN